MPLFLQQAWLSGRKLSFISAQTLSWVFKWEFKWELLAGVTCSHHWLELYSSFHKEHSQTVSLGQSKTCCCIFVSWSRVSINVLWAQPTSEARQAVLAFQMILSSLNGPLGGGRPWSFLVLMWITISQIIDLSFYLKGICCFPWNMRKSKAQSLEWPLFAPPRSTLHPSPTSSVI